MTTKQIRNANPETGNVTSRGSSLPETHPRARLTTRQGATGASDDDAINARALKILEFRARYVENVSISSPGAARDFCRLQLGSLPHEVFGVLWLDAQNRLIAFDEIFRGTLTQTSVYPREVVKAALAHNAAGVILAHNHPSGVAEPSCADELLTTSLKQALALVDVRVLDHLVVAAAGVTSFAERGLI
jgi:DNA repair protein RadC